MKKLVILIFLLSITLSDSISQIGELDFGKVKQIEVDYKHDQDQDAEAVVLYDIGMSYFVRSENGYEIVFERNMRIKILSDGGLEWGEIEIPFYQSKESREKVKKIKAITINYDGVSLNKSDLAEENIFEEKINEYWRVKKFAMPDVKTGSIIDVSYKVITQNIFDFKDWEFQWEIPVLYSKYTAKMIPFYEYTYIMQGASKFDEQRSYVDEGLERTFGSVTFKDYIHEFTMRNIPAFRDESFITSKDDYLIKLDFQLSKVNQPDGYTLQYLTTWDKMIEDLLKNDDFGRYVKKSTKINQKSSFINGVSQLPSNEKFNKIIENVKSNYSWNGYVGKYAYHSVNDLITNKYGPSPDINLFAVGMLRAAGLEAYPVIVSTRDNGKIKSDYPFSHFFNYVIIMVQLDGKMYLTDATDPLISNYRIPPRCINDIGLLIKEGEVTWLNLTTPTISLTGTTVKIVPEDGIIKAHVQKSSTEYSAYNQRKEYGNDVELLAEQISNKGYEIVDSSLNIVYAEEINKPYKYSYEVEQPSTSVGDKIIISPFLNEIYSDNPLKQKKRSYPVDMIYPRKETFMSIIEIPTGYEVEYLPDLREIDNSLFLLTYNTSRNGDKLNVTLTYNFKKPVYQPEEYARIKFYFNEIVKYGNEQIILKRKELSSL